MERASLQSTPTGVNGSALAGWLTRLDLLDGPGHGVSCVEGLGRWLGWTDALALSGALQAPVGTARHASAEELAAAAREFERVRAALVRAIEDDRSLVDETEFAPYRQHCMALQQQMDARIGPLRKRLRDWVARQSPELARLAAIDAAMADAMAPHAQRLLGRLPSLLEKHFRRLRAARADETANARDDGLAAFRRDLRALLMADLALRLQPAQGLLDTLCPPSQDPHD